MADNTDKKSKFDPNNIKLKKKYEQSGEIYLMQAKRTVPVSSLVKMPVYFIQKYPSLAAMYEISEEDVAKVKKLRLRDFI